MKTNLSLALATIAVAACMVSCIFDEADCPLTDDELFPIGFSSIEVSSTYAAEVTLDSLKKAGFRVFAWKTGVDAWADFTRDNAPDFMLLDDGKGVPLTWDGSNWTYAPVKYWPGKIGGVDGKVTFFAYSPAAGSATNVTAVTTVDALPKLYFTAALLAKDQKDLVADARYDRSYTTNGGDVVFTLNHILSKISFHAKLNNEDDVLAGATATIDRLIIEYTDMIKRTGIYTFPASNDAKGSWTSWPGVMTGRDTIVRAPLADVTISSASASTAIDGGNILMLLPQETRDGDLKAIVEYSITDANGTIKYQSKPTPLPALNWEHGMQHIYTFYLSRNPITIQTIVTGWDERGTGADAPHYEMPEVFDNGSNANGMSVIDWIKTTATDLAVLYLEMPSGTETETVSFGAGDLQGGLVLSHTGARDTWTSSARIIIDGGGRTADLTGQPSGNPLITVGTGVTLTLRNITFKGLKSGDGSDGNNTAPLIRVDGGTLILENDASLTGNRNAGGCDAGAGGVVVTSGEFIMNGGTISGNSGTLGGGVALYGSAGGSFTMNGGTISGNRSVAAGGGVYVANSSYTYTNDGGGTVNEKNAG